MEPGNRKIDSSPWNHPDVCASINGKTGCRERCRILSKTSPSDQTQTSRQTKPVTRKPAMFRVLMHNDDYTSMEFVVEALMDVFHKSATEANRIMLHIHFKGVGHCGIYPFEVAETKVAKVHDMARAQSYPLKCSLEQA